MRLRLDNVCGAGIGETSSGNLLKHVISTVAVGGLVCALAVAGVATNAESLSRKVAPLQIAASLAPVTPAVETDSQKRERLNLRLQAMMRSGEGARLSDPRAVARSRSASTRAQAPIASARARIVRREQGPTRTETSTIAPPTARSKPVVGGFGYRAPVLDLRTPIAVPANDVECLTQALYYEARNESEEGQAAVAEVVLNRSRSGTYPKSICQVVYQRNSRTCQFTFTCDGSIGRGAVNMTAWGRAERIAREVYEGRSRPLLPTNSVNYHANYVRPSWGRQLERVRQIGAHIFYGAALNGHSTPGAQAIAPAKPASGGLQFVSLETLISKGREAQTRPNSAAF